MSDRRAFDGFCAGIDDQPRPRTVLHGEPVDEEHFQDLSKGQFLPFCPDLTHRFEYIACNDPDDEGLFKELFGQRRKVAEECEMWSARRLMDSSGEHMYPEFLEHFYEPPCPCPLYQPVEIAGTYFSSPHRIEYYKGAHKTITTLHERFHALHHLTPDSNGDIWIDFPRAGRFAKEMLAQLFTYKWIELNLPDTLPDFTRRTDGQGILYQTYRAYQNRSPDEVVELYWAIRMRKAGGWLDRMPRRRLGLDPRSPFPSDSITLRFRTPAGRETDDSAQHFIQAVGDPILKLLGVQLGTPSRSKELDPFLGWEKSECTSSIVFPSMAPQGSGRHENWPERMKTTRRLVEVLNTLRKAPAFMSLRLGRILIPSE